MQLRRFKLLFAIIVFVIVIWAIINMVSPKWVSLYDIKYCAKLKDETITQITMRATIDSVEEVVFSDKDLIDEWVSFFDNVTLKFNWKETYFHKWVNGGHPLINVQTDKCSYNMIFHATKDGMWLIIDKNRYMIKEPEKMPFYQIYETAVERHGRVSIS